MSQSSEQSVVSHPLPSCMKIGGGGQLAALKDLSLSPGTIYQMVPVLFK